MEAVSSESDKKRQGIGKLATLYSGGYAASVKKAGLSSR